MIKYSLIPPKDHHYDLLKEIHHTLLRDFITQIWGWDDIRQEEFFRGDFKSGRMQLIQIGEEGAGYLQIRNEENALFIENLLILPKFQSRGLGSQIIRDVIARAKSAKHLVRLGVFKINPRAKKLYESLGFKIYEETTIHYMMEF